MYAPPAVDSSRRSAIRCFSDGETETAVSDAHPCVTDRRSAAVDDATDTPSHTRTTAVNMAAMSMSAADDDEEENSADDDSQEIHHTTMMTTKSVVVGDTENNR